MKHPPTLKMILLGALLLAAVLVSTLPLLAACSALSNATASMDTSGMG